jgi:hypothetical protein
MADNILKALWLLLLVPLLIPSLAVGQSGPIPTTYFSHA